jgi:hypothetical protein
MVKPRRRLGAAVVVTDNPDGLARGAKEAKPLAGLANEH